MQARVRSDYRFSVVTAFTGREFIKGEWRLVPAGCEDEAIHHIALDVQDDPQPLPVAKETYTVTQLREMAKKAGIKGYSRMKEATLLERLGLSE